MPFPPLSRRTLNFAAAGVCAGMLGFALFSQHVLGYEPCPLCIFQRVGVFALGVAFLLAALHHPGTTGARIYAALIFVAAGSTVGVAARHVYIQSLPPGTVPACGAPLEVMLEFSPLFEVVRKVLTASGECGTVDWTLLGLSMPAWVLIAVLGLGVAGVLVNVLLPREGRRLPSGEIRS